MRRIASSTHHHHHHHHHHQVLAKHEENLTPAQVAKLEGMIARMESGGICSAPEDGNWDWSFRGSLYFVFTLITTIGWVLRSTRGRGGVPVRPTLVLMTYTCSIVGS